MYGEFNDILLSRMDLSGSRLRCSVGWHFRNQECMSLAGGPDGFFRLLFVTDDDVMGFDVVVGLGYISKRYFESNVCEMSSRVSLDWTLDSLTLDSVCNAHDKRCLSFITLVSKNNDILSLVSASFGITIRSPLFSFSPA